MAHQKMGNEKEYYRNSQESKKTNQLNALKVSNNISNNISNNNSIRFREYNNQTNNYNKSKKKEE